MKNVERNIKIDLLTARKWYNGNNPVLKELALKAFTKNELEEIMFEEIIELYSNDIRSMNVPSKLYSELKAICILRTLADFFNPSGWKPSSSEIKFFIYRDDYTKEWFVKQHSSVAYPGLIYFKKQDDAIRVIKMIKENNQYFKNL